MCMFSRTVSSLVIRALRFVWMPLNVQAGEVVHQLLDLRRLGRHFGVCRLQLMEDRRRRIRVEAHFDVEDPGDQALGLQGRAQAGFDPLQGAVREEFA